MKTKGIGESGCPFNSFFSFLFSLPNGKREEKNRVDGLGRPREQSSSRAAVPLAAVFVGFSWLFLLAVPVMGCPAANGSAQGRERQEKKPTNEAEEQERECNE